MVGLEHEQDKQDFKNLLNFQKGELDCSHFIQGLIFLPLDLTAAIHFSPRITMGSGVSKTYFLAS